MQTGLTEVTIPESKAELQHPLDTLSTCLELQLASMVVEYGVSGDIPTLPIDAFRRQRNFRREVDSRSDDNAITKLFEILRIVDSTQATSIRSSFSWVLKGMGNLLGRESSRYVDTLIDILDTYIVDETNPPDDIAAIRRISLALQKILGNVAVNQFVGFDQQSPSPIES